MDAATLSLLAVDINVLLVRTRTPPLLSCYFVTAGHIEPSESLRSSIEVRLAP